MIDGIASLLETVRIRWSLPIAGAVVAGALALMSPHETHMRQQVQPVSLEHHHCRDDAHRTPTLRSIELERRWLINQASPEAIDDALRTHVDAWQPFMYLLDAQPRMAVAGPAHPHEEVWSYEFAQDDDGGIWLVNAKKTVPTHLDVLFFNREIFVLPAGTSFRGVRDR